MVSSQAVRSVRWLWAPLSLALLWVQGPLAANFTPGVRAPFNDCIADARSTSVVGFPDCAKAIDTFLSDVARARGQQGFNQRAPERIYWLDNLAVACYSAFFVVAAMTAYRLRSRASAGVRWRACLALTLVAVAAGALADYGENIWVLARLGDIASHQPGAAESVAVMSVWKLRLFGVNVALSLGWIALAVALHVQRSRAGAPVTS